MSLEGFDGRAHRWSVRHRCALAGASHRLHRKAEAAGAQHVGGSGARHALTSGSPRRVSAHRAARQPPSTATNRDARPKPNRTEPNEVIGAQTTAKLGTDPAVDREPSARAKLTCCSAAERSKGGTRVRKTTLAVSTSREYANAVQRAVCDPQPPADGSATLSSGTMPRVTRKAGSDRSTPRL